MSMFKKVSGLALVGLLSLSLTTHKAEAAYNYVGSDSPKFVMKNNDANAVGSVHESSGGKYQIRIPAQKITKYPVRAKTELYVTLYEMDGSKKQLIDQWVYRGADRVKEEHTITKDISKWVDGKDKKAELKVYYHTNYSGGFTAKFYD